MARMGSDDPVNVVGICGIGGRVDLDLLMYSGTQRASVVKYHVIVLRKLESMDRCRLSVHGHPNGLIVFDVGRPADQKPPPGAGPE